MLHCLVSDSAHVHENVDAFAVPAMASLQSPPALAHPLEICEKNKEILVMDIPGFR